MNATRVGKPAGRIRTDPRNGYLNHIVGVDGNKYLTSRVIIKLVLNIEPEEVDHWDKDGTNNRWGNLRPCTHAENTRNRGAHKNNGSGLKGAFFDRAKGRYMTSLMVNGKVRWFGYYDTPEEAHAKYCELSAEFHGVFGRTK